MQDVWLSEEWPLGVVNLGPAKTSKYAARRQHVLIDEPFLLQALRKLKRLIPPGGHIFPLSPAAFAQRLRLIQQAIGVPPLVTPGSFRGGGATHMWLTQRNFEAVRLRGRWAAPGRTLEFYLQECLTFYGEGSFTAQQQQRIRTLAGAAVELISSWLRA